MAFNSWDDNANASRPGEQATTADVAGMAPNSTSDDMNTHTSWKCNKTDIPDSADHSSRRDDEQALPLIAEEELVTHMQ